MRASRLWAWAIAILLPAAFARGAEPPKPVTIADDFQTDSRPQYEIAGDVKWEKGRLLIGPGAQVARKVPPSPVVELTLDLEVPPPPAQGEMTVAEVGFELANGEAVSWAISRKTHEGKPVAEIRLVKRAGPGGAGLSKPSAGPRGREKDVEVRKFLFVEQLPQAPWQFRCRWGCLLFDLGGRASMAGWPEVGTFNVSRLFWIAKSPGVSMRRMAVAAADRAVSDAQEKDLVEAARSLPAILKLHEEGKLAHADAVSQAERCRRTLAEIVGSDHPLHWGALLNVGKLYRSIGAPATAEPLYVQACEISANVFGVKHPDYAKSLNRLGALYDSMGQYAKAEPLLVNAGEIRREIFGEDDLNCVETLNELGSLYFHTGEYAKAERHYVQVCEILKKRLGEDHPYCVTALGNLAEAYHAMGEDAKAGPLYAQALQIARKALGEYHVDYAKALRGLAGYYMATSEYAKAEPLYLEARDIWTRTRGENNEEYVMILSHLANLHWAMGDYAKAEPLLVRAREIARDVLGEGHPVYAMTLHNLAFVYATGNERAKAESLYLEALDTVGQRLGKNHPDYASGLHNLGGLYDEMGEYAKAEPLHVQARDVRKKVLGENHPDYARSLGILAEFYWEMGEHAKAEPLLVEAGGILKRVSGEKDPSHAQIEFKLATLYLATGKDAQAEAIYRRTLQDELAWWNGILPSLSEAQAMSMRSRAVGCDPLLSVLRRRPEPNANDAYGAVWGNQGLASRMLARRRAQAAASPQAQSLYAELRATAQQLAQLTLAATSPDQRQARQRRLAELNERKERLEIELARASAEHRRSQQIAEASPEDLLRLIPKDTAIVEFHRAAVWARPPPKSRRRYIIDWQYDAFVLRPGDNSAERRLTWVQLGPAHTIDEAFGQWRQFVSLCKGRRTEPADPQPLPSPEQTLRKLIWEKIEPHLPGCSAVIVVPDGDLCVLPWTALPGRKPGTFLIEDYAIGVAPGAHSLYAVLSDRPSMAGSPLLVGDAQFDAPPASSVDPALQLARREATKAERTRGPATTERQKWDQLRNTAEEVQAIGRLWAGSPRPTFLQGAAASEESLRILLPQSRFVHLATHGFLANERFRSMFGHDTQGERLFGTGVLSDANWTSVTARNPLILSGVVLAGANLPPKADSLGLPTGEDGILTAEEIVNLDLRNNELVVLSACETGLGRVAGGEGVMGLARAFHLAGARSVVTSLWKVDDRATQALMVEFYKNLWQRKLGKLESLRQAQLTMIRQYDAKSGQLRGAGAARPVDPAKLAAAPEVEGKPTGPLPPFYWAAFQLSGDWR